MSSREKILAAVKKNQPEETGLPSLDGLSGAMPATLEAFRKVLEGLGGVLCEVGNKSEVLPLLRERYPDLKRVIVAEDADQQDWVHEDPHALEDVDMAVVNGQWGIAENGSVWVTEQEIKIRVLPFICQHLAIILSRGNILATMHEAYERIGAPQSGFGVFIAGPSKTADIEQSLVLGAHGARSLTVLILP
ncbi:MAG TPA: LUD domain-containing protein [Chitinophaga sp.]|uniref:LutC/YkgG family protein n=1 Tax=Chitinophaga sp. TaxID=1869181 RepID=UPI002B60378F|nr:LUD domain-containing protein [Chitinophaga sp.]HVI48408.1 LUD domain-containing protein [Chitinophaga sp.]